MDGWKTTFLFRRLIFQEICSFQGGYPHNLSIHPSKGGMGVTCAHHGSLAPIGGGSLAPIGGTEDIHTFRVRHGDIIGTWGLGDMVQKTYKPLGLDMGTWCSGDMGTWRHTDTGTRICHI